MNVKLAKKSSIVPVQEIVVSISDDIFEDVSEKDISEEIVSQEDEVNLVSGLTDFTSEDFVLEIIEDLVISAANKSQANTLKVPKPYHPKPKIHSCSICGKLFSQYKSAKKHKLGCKGSTKSRPVHCDVCKKPLADERSLKRHMNTHNNPKPKEIYHCVECNVTFSKKNKLKVHNEKKHGQVLATLGDAKKCLVEGCDFEHVKESFMKAHMTRVHDTKEKVTCNLCTFQCYSSSGMKKHMRSIHEVSSSDTAIDPEAEESSNTEMVNVDLEENIDGERMRNVPMSSSDIVFHPATVVTSNLDMSQFELEQMLSANLPNQSASSQESVIEFSMM